MSGRISFIGAGPGAADLITVRGARRIAEADVVVWSASLVAQECLREHARADSELVDSSRLARDEALEIYRRAERDKLRVARLYSGDPSLWSAVQDQYDACERMAVEVEIVPGVAAFSAAAAEVGRELTVSDAAQSLVLSRLEGDMTTIPDREKVREFAKHGTTMALFLSAARTGQLAEQLRAGGYEDDVPVLVAYKITWPDELVLRTTLGELEKTVKQHRLWRQTLFIVGKALGGNGPRSQYASGASHTYRSADPFARTSPRTSGAQRWRFARRDSPRTSPENLSQGRPSQGWSSSDWMPDSVPGPREGYPRSGRRPAEVRPAGKQLDSEVAWWAVRDWQQSAQEVVRAASARTSTRRASGNGSAQADLFVDAEAAVQEGVSVAGEVQAEGALGEVVDYVPVAAEPGAVKPQGESVSAEAAGSVEVAPEVAPELSSEPEPVEAVQVEPTEAEAGEEDSGEPAAPEAKPATSAQRKTASASTEAETKPKSGTKTKSGSTGAKPAGGGKSNEAKSGSTTSKKSTRRKSGGAKEERGNRR